MKIFAFWLKFNRRLFLRVQIAISHNRQSLQVMIRRLFGTKPLLGAMIMVCNHDDAYIATQPQSWWRHQLKHFPRYWPFVREIHRSPVNSPHKGQWRRALMFSLICARINGWENNGEADDLRRHRAHHDAIIMNIFSVTFCEMISSVICLPRSLPHHSIDYQR